MRFVFCGAALAAMLVVGCSAPSPMRLNEAEDVKVSYAGSVGDTGAVLTVPEFDAPAKSDRPLTITATVIQVPADVAANVFQGSAMPHALSLTFEEAAELGRRLSGEQPTRLYKLQPPNTGEQREPAKDVAELQARYKAALASPRITTYSGQRCTLELVKETAYIGGFEITSQGGGWVADPVVRTFKSGIQLGVLPTLHKTGDIEIDLQIVVSEALRPIGQAQVSVLGAPMTVQSPTIMTQKLSATGVMQKDRWLLLTGLLGPGDQVLLVVVHGRQASEVPDDSMTEPKKD